ncbi:MAG: trigger factor [Candidatus Omnitrophota bacterium]
MKTQVKKIDQHKRELSVEVEGDIVTKKFDEVYKRIGREAKVSGFRPGNAPRDILEKHYSNLANQEALKELLPEVYSQALAEAKIEPASPPEISQVNFNKSNLSFKANLEVKPQINLSSYKGLKIEYKPIEVTGEEIKKAFDKLKENYAQMPEDDCVHSLGYPNLEALKEVFKKQIYLEKARAQQIGIENGVIEQLLKQLDFQVPSGLINGQLERLVKQAELDLSLRGMNKEEIDKQGAAMKENLRPEAEKQVRVFLVLEEVARRENIGRDEKMSQQAVEFLLRQANWKIT